MVELLWSLLEPGSANTVVLRAKGNIECLKKCKTFSFSCSRFLSVHVIIFLDSAGNQFQCFPCVMRLRVRSLNPINVNKTNFWCPQTNNRIPFVQVFVEVITKVGKFQISYRRRLFHNFWWVSALFPSSICGKIHRHGSKCLQRSIRWNPCNFHCWHVSWNTVLIFAHFPLLHPFYLHFRKGIQTFK